jgi:tetratricopeptide (TPR) repeat protein
VDWDARIAQLEAAPAHEKNAQDFGVRLAEAYVGRATQRIEAGRLPQAEQDLERAATLAGEAPICIVGRLRLARRQNQLPNVIALANLAKVRGVPLPVWGEELVRAFLAAGRADAAAGTLEKILESPAVYLDPAAATLWQLRAELARTRGSVEDLRQAAEALEICAMFRPADAAAWVDWAKAQLRYGAALEDAGQTAAALEARRGARRSAHAACVLGSASAEARVTLARAWRALGEREAARAALEEARVLGGPGFQLPADLR